jgi:hypothetical protein
LCCSSYQPLVNGGTVDENDEHALIANNARALAAATPVNAAGANSAQVRRIFFGFMPFQPLHEEHCLLVTASVCLYVGHLDSLLLILNTSHAEVKIQLTNEVWITSRLLIIQQTV